MKNSCPGCLSNNFGNIIYKRKGCPVLNNVVYESSNDGRSCLTADIRLVQCEKCGLVYNIDFDNSIIEYNQCYDNSRNHSEIYSDYIDSLVSCYATYLSHESTVLEIGCGNDGHFLKKLSDITGCHGVGYDNAYQGILNYNNKVVFHKQYFNSDNINNKYDLIILRHVLEHIIEPNLFLKNQICESALLKDGGFVFIEIPDFNWIIVKGSFFDITYEHCNYFTQNSIFALLQSCNLKITNFRKVFGNQYLAIDAQQNSKQSIFEKTDLLPNVEDKPFEIFENSKQNLIECILKAENVCIWGASGKGVILLSDLPLEIVEKISYVIDINPNKQGKFLPLSAKKIYPPDILKNHKGKLLVIVMNEVYKEEISVMLENMEVGAFLITP